jgi:hypothetical protein
MCDLNEIIGTRLNEDGVGTLTRGMIICAQVRDNLRDLLQHVDEPGYAEYRKLKYPFGEGSDTDETRIKATAFLFDRSRDTLLPHYVSSKELTA